MTASNNNPALLWLCVTSLFPYVHLVGLNRMKLWLWTKVNEISKYGVNTHLAPRRDGTGHTHTVVRNHLHDLAKCNPKKPLFIFYFLLFIVCTTLIRARAHRWGVVLCARRECAFEEKGNHDSIRIAFRCDAASGSLTTFGQFPVDLYLMFVCMHCVLIPQGARTSRTGKQITIDWIAQQKSLFTCTTVSHLDVLTFWQFIVSVGRNMITYKFPGAAAASTDTN